MLLFSSKRNYPGENDAPPIFTGLTVSTGSPVERLEKGLTAMKRIVLCAFAALLVGVALEVRAADFTGQITATMNPTKTTLTVPLPGSPFVNTGTYYEETATLRWQKFSFYGAYQSGLSNHIDGAGNFFSPTFNPLSGEMTRISDLNAEYQVVNTRYTGPLSLGVGYLHISDDPEIAPKTTYEGVTASLHGRAALTKQITIDYRFVYLPNFSVGGYSAQNFSEDYIYHYRIAAEFPLYNSLGLTAGYQDFTIRLRVKADGAPASAHPRGWFGGLLYRF